MKDTLLRVAAALPGLAMLVNGVGFVLTPREAVESLGMPLLDGVGRSTQIGDIGGLFIGTAVLIFVAAARRRSGGLYAAALLIGLVAVLRVFTHLVHGADLAMNFIVAEVVLTVWLLLFAWLFRARTA